MRGGGGGTFGMRDGEHAVGQIRRDAIAVDLLGELEHAPEGAVAALDLVIVNRVAAMTAGLRDVP